MVLVSQFCFLNVAGCGGFVCGTATGAAAERSGEAGGHLGAASATSFTIKRPSALPRGGGGAAPACAAVAHSSPAAEASSARAAAPVASTDQSPHRCCAQAAQQSGLTLPARRAPPAATAAAVGTARHAARLLFPSERGACRCSASLCNRVGHRWSTHPCHARGIRRCLFWPGSSRPVPRAPCLLAAGGWRAISIQPASQHG